MRKWGIAYTSSRIQPFSLASLPISYSRKQIIPAQTRQGEGKEDETSTIIKIKTSIQTYKHSNVLSKLRLLHKSHNSSSNKNLKGLEHPTTFRARDRQPEERPGTEAP
jgi:hypothetical protein